jgi:hypothetical protein
MRRLGRLVVDSGFGFLRFLSARRFLSVFLGLWPFLVLAFVPFLALLVVY